MREQFVPELLPYFEMSSPYSRGNEVRKMGSQNQSIETTRIISNIYISRLDLLFLAYFMPNGYVLISCIRFLVCRTAKYTNICVHIYENIYTHMFVYSIHVCINVMLICVCIHTCLNLHIYMRHTSITTGIRHCAALDTSGHIHESVTQHI